MNRSKDDLKDSVGLVDPSKPVNIKRAAVALGVGYSTVAALKKAAGIKGYYFDLAELRRWWRKNPGFKTSDVYPKKSQNGVGAVA